VISKEQFDEVRTFVKHYLQESFMKSEEEWKERFPRSAEYRWQHTLNVLQNAEKIIAGEEIDEPQADILRFAAILHDVSMFDADHKVHGKVSAEISEKYLLDQGYETEFSKQVCLAVAEHGTDLGPIPPSDQGKQLSGVGKVLIEADILDKLGASAITSALLMLGEEGKLNHECRLALAEGIAMQRAVFFKDYIWTETGKKLAEQRFSFFQKYLDQLMEEVVEGG
jgi:uncharacterized protein